MRRMLKICLAIGVVSEVIKFFSVSQIVPMIDRFKANEDGSIDFVYRGDYIAALSPEHLPFEMCSLQI
ncbi:MAG TPA: hypothetical protein DCR12_02755, partial [Lachnospiraceae bacterium]|nr:hypothetical protein [Lachnospiraceae bacterium]